MSQTSSFFDDKSSEPETAQKKPHYAGHRQRMRDRFLRSGSDGFQDYELLELLLFMAIPRRDVKPLAKELLKQFGSYPALMAAPIERLTAVPGISKNVAVALKAVDATAKRLLRQEVMKKRVLNTWERLMDYCMATMAHEPKEHFRLLFLNKKNELMGDEIQGTGTVDHTPAYTREVIRRAFEVNATAIILVHNHPSGDPTPSEADIEITREIMRAAETVKIVVHDHIIVSRNGYTSMKNEGWI